MFLKDGEISVSVAMRQAIPFRKREERAYPVHVPSGCPRRKHKTRRQLIFFGSAKLSVFICLLRS